MALNDTALNLMGDALAAAAPYISLHTDGSGTETTAARLAAGWGAASGGDFSIGSPKAFTGGASNGSVTHVGLHSAASGGTYYGSYPVTGDASFNSAGEYNLDSFTVAGS